MYILGTVKVLANLTFTLTLAISAKFQCHMTHIMEGQWSRLMVYEIIVFFQTVQPPTCQAEKKQAIVQQIIGITDNVMWAKAHH